MIPGAANRFEWDSAAFQEIFHFGKWIFVATIFGFLMDSGDRLLLGGLVSPDTKDRGWRFSFLAGLIIAPLIYGLFSAGPPEVMIPVTTPFLIIGGILVGLGTQIGSGCTSGHGVCGMSRLSPRSVTATLVFMATGMITVFLVRHVGG